MDKKGNNKEELKAVEANESNILSMENIKKIHENEYKQIDAYVAVGDEMLSYKVYEKFPIRLRDEYVFEILDFATKCAIDEEYIENNYINQLGIYTLILMIDKFTDLEFPEDVGSKIVYASYLLDLGIFNTILDTMDQEETKKLIEESEKVIKDYEDKTIAKLEELRADNPMINEKKNVNNVNLEAVTAINEAKKELDNNKK